MAVTIRPTMPTRSSMARSIVPTVAAISAYPKIAGRLDNADWSLLATLADSPSSRRRATAMRAELKNIVIE